MPEVIVRVELPAGIAPTEPVAHIRIVVEDVSLADAAAEPVAETILEDVGLRDLRALEVAVEVDQYDERRHYACRVHVDREGTGEVERGDLISTASHPVLTHGYALTTRVPLRQV
jgi:hypothetical protein